jgi:FkbM family methyltransferase
MKSLLNDFLLFYARRGPGRSMRSSAFRKFCRRNRGKAFVADTGYGFRFRTVLGDAVDNQIYVNGVFEPETSRLFSAIAGECASFIDIGCNIGYFSCLFGRRNPDARIFCIDANPKMVERTRENMGLNGRDAEFLNFGVSNRKGSLKLFIPKGRHSLSSFAYRPEKGGEIEEIAVEIKRLGELISFEELDSACLKVDTEGFEFNVFSGIEPKEAERLKYVIFECNESNIQKAGQSAEAIFSISWVKNFHAYEIQENSGGLIPIRSEMGNYPTNANILLINSKIGESKASELSCLPGRLF